MQKRQKQNEANSIFSHESEVRIYCRRIGSTFTRAVNAEVWDEEGRRYIDLLAGCGALNYGHNNPQIRDAVVDYMKSDGITSSMDLHTIAKRDFLEAFVDTILMPRGLDYKVQFCGPTGTNSVEAALKLARKVTGRSTVIAFENGYHGMSLGALSVTTNEAARRAAGVPLRHAVLLPYEDPNDLGAPLLSLYESLMNERPSHSLPAAFIVETVQAEGGLNTASRQWLQELQRTARRLGALLIVDDIQAGCGRTGHFFSFEDAGIEPDIVCLSKSIGGMGMPMSLVLMRPDLDVWQPGEHTGTFRGNNLAFVAGRAALEFWTTPDFEKEIAAKAELVTETLDRLADAHAGRIFPKGLGLMQGLEFSKRKHAQQVAEIAILNGILLETCGPNDEVLKILPPLTIETSLLEDALGILESAIQFVLVEQDAEELCLAD
jgi:diaminobutyrate-2-oxoglutarate transaminase